MENVIKLDTKEQKPKKPPVNWEDKFAEQLEEAGLKGFAREFYGIPRRRYRFDFAREDMMVAIEIEGGSWGGSSRHTSGAGFKSDCRKYNLATSLGWRVYRFTSDQVRDKEAIAFLKEVLHERAG